MRPFHNHFRPPHYYIGNREVTDHDTIGQALTFSKHHDVSSVKNEMKANFPQHAWEVVEL
jgi:hypothetical protein